MLGLFEDHGIRFEYPADWKIEVESSGPQTTVALHAPDGIAFGLITLDETQPEPDEVAELALVAMQDEYPGLEAVAAVETIGGYRAVGHDVDFLSFDIASGCAIRCYQSPRRTVLIFGQWSDLEDGDPEAQFLALRKSIEETDG